MLHGFFRPGEVQFFAKHDDRKGHHYYTRWLHRPTQACIVVMTLAVIMGGGILQKNETHPFRPRCEKVEINNDTIQNIT